MLRVYNKVLKTCSPDFTLITRPLGVFNALKKRNAFKGHTNQHKQSRNMPAIFPVGSEADASDISFPTVISLDHARKFILNRCFVCSVVTKDHILPDTQRSTHFIYIVLLSFERIAQQCVMKHSALLNVSSVRVVVGES